MIRLRGYYWLITNASEVSKSIHVHANSAVHLKSREVLLGTLRSRVHCSITRLPSGGADLIRVGLNVLESLEDTEGLVNGTTERQVIDGRVLDNTFLVNDEKSTESNTISGEYLVSFGDFTLQVGDQGVSKVAEATLVTGGLDPGQVRELGVNGDTEDLSVDGLELSIAVAEGGDLSGAHKSEIKRVEEENNILALLEFKKNMLEIDLE